MLNPQGTSIVYSNLLTRGISNCSNGDSFGHGVAVDSEGDAYFTGATCSSSNIPSGFPTTENAFQNTIGSLTGSGAGVFDAYVVRLGSAATCASNLSASVSITRSGFGFNFGTGRFYQRVTLTNSGSSPISDALSLVLDGLSSNAGLFNKTGTTACEAPTGSSFINLTGPLGPGASASVVLQFTDPTKAAIKYSTRVLAGNGDR